jgi:hypothetical protein
MVRPVVGLCLALMLTIATSGDAHPLHSSFTEISRERGGTISISVRLFTDDFGVALDSMRAKGRGAASETVAQEYFARSVVLTTADGKPVQLEWCGMRSQDGLTWLCARSVAPVPPGRLRLRNALMFDRFRDQISVVRWDRGSETRGSVARTLVLSARAPEGQLE